MSVQAGRLQSVHRRIEGDHDSVIATKALLTEVAVYVDITTMGPEERKQFSELQAQARAALLEAERHLARAALFVSRLRGIVP